MADIYLGLTESGATLLPPLRWMDGRAPNLPTDYSKQVDKATMLSGATRFNIRSQHPRRWALAWEALTAAEATSLRDLRDENQELVFQNNWESTDWHTVVMTQFDVTPYLKAGSTGCRYAVSMTLEEAYG